MIRKKIRFHGWVQGVGFRYRAREAANLYGCTGWVKNEYDGTVTMEIQGSENQIDQVILAIERGHFIRIENMECRTIPVDDEEYSFRVSVGIFLSSRIVTNRVFSAPLSLTSVFGMGTGGPSTSSTPTFILSLTT